MSAWLLVLLLGCGPDPCELMCEEAALQTAACVEGGEGSWEALGYGDREDFQDACETWAWEERMLRREAGESAGQLEATCEEWRGEEIGEECETPWVEG